MNPGSPAPFSSSNNTDSQVHTMAPACLIRWIAALLSSSVLEEMHLPENKSALSQVYYWDEYNSSLEFYTEYDWTRYQYINWEENALSNFILR